jgi:hypothetical protein
MKKFFNKIIRNEKIIEKYASGSLHFIFPPLLYGKITLAQHSICDILLRSASQNIAYTETLYNIYFLTEIQQFTDYHRKQKLFIVLSELFWGEKK